MKTTGVALYIYDGSVMWGHVGDSRLYYFLNGRLISQTIDHSVSQLAVFAGEITTEQIRLHEDRNKLHRAFGGHEGLSPDITPPMTIDQGFHVFLLCTDGFWEYVLETEMESDLKRSATPQDWIYEMLQRLTARAPGNNDNYSAAALFIHNNV